MPDRLDLNEWIQLSLDSVDETDRQIALEELVTTGVPPYLQAKLREISARDASPGCRQLAAWIENLDRLKAELKPQMKGLDLTPDAIESLLENDEPGRASVIIQLLRKAPSEQALQQWRERLATEKNPRLLEIGLTILGKFGVAADADFATMLLLEADVEVVCAALSLLHQRDEDVFKRQVRTGLTSRSFRVQLHAVHLLRLVDSNEALKYIKAFLFHKNQLIRQRALRELMLIDFSRVENLFLQYLGTEIQPLLLVKAGFVAAFNPSREFPLKIFDIMLLSKDLKKHIMQLILRQSVEAVQAAGLLDQPLEAYMADLKKQIDRRRAEIIIRCAVRELASPRRELRAAAIERLSQYAAYPSIIQALKKHLEIESDDELKKSICLLLEPVTVPAAERETAAPAKSAEEPKAFPGPQSFLKLPLMEQRRLLKGISDNTSFLAARHTLFDLLNSDIKKSLILDILKVIYELGSRIDVPSILPLLESSEPPIKAMAVKTLGKLDLDSILPTLNQFLADEDPRIKSAALEVYLFADKEGAVQYLSSMLRSAVADTRRIGLSLLPQLDYPSAEPLLLRMLKYEANDELIVQASYMVAANPTRDGLELLFANTHDKLGELKPGAEEIWQMAMISAESVFDQPAVDIEAACWEAYKVEHAEPSSEKSAYAYDSVVGEDDDELPPPPSDGDDQTPVEQLFLHLYEFKWHYIVGVVVIIPIMFSLLSSNEPEYKGRRGGMSEHGAPVSFLPTEQKSTSDTQVGSGDWQGYLKTGAREVLGGKAYAKAISSGREEVDKIRYDNERAYRQSLIDKANDPAQPEEVRQMAAAYSHPGFARAIDAYDLKNMSEAEVYFEQCVEDSQLNSVGKCLALTRLAEIAQAKGDRASWMKWQDRLLKELKNVPEYKDIAAFQDFGRYFSSVMDISNQLSIDGTGADEILTGLKAQGDSDTEARENLEVLKGMDGQFQKMFSGHP
ncbi:MAG: HEAT repeat domain-containing protein [Candidatus Riflebacteria bacterium]|nr:HEAT repeat domain-containing protein [Candidatus Riflebacteria bacterium]